MSEIRIRAGIACIALALAAVTAPYWLMKENTRKDDEELPSWMGEARDRKIRLLWIAAAFITVIGVGLIVLTQLNPP